MSSLPTAPAKTLLTYVLKPEEDYEYKTLSLLWRVVWNLVCSVGCWYSDQRTLGRAHCSSAGGPRLSLLLGPFLILCQSVPFPFNLEEAWHRMTKLSRDVLVRLVTGLACDDSNKKSLYLFSRFYGIWCHLRSARAIFSFTMPQSIELKKNQLIYRLNKLRHQQDEAQTVKWTII
jgi:hypothetical protein